MNTETPAIPRILLVESDPDHRALICEALSIHYDRPFEQDGLAVADAAGCTRQDLDRFDVILIDQDLPDMSGVALLEKVLRRADLPVILMTGQSDLATAAEAIRAGAQDYLVKVGDYLFALPVVIDKSIRQHRTQRENQRLQQELQAMLGELQVRNAQLRESLQKLQELATTDALTGLANRRSFHEVLPRMFAEAARYGHNLACCMFDLDEYKGINDTLGHQLGDELLVIVAEAVRSGLRLSDVAARYGGDEFVLLLPHTSCEQARIVGDRIRREVARRTAYHPVISRRVTLSMGIASLAEHSPADPEALIAQADRSLYAAKQQGRDRIVVHA